MPANPLNDTLREELREMQRQLKALQDARDAEKLDERFANIHKEISANRSAVEKRLIEIEGRQSNVLSILEQQTKSIAEMREQLNKGIGMQGVDNGVEGPVIYKQLGETFRLQRQLIE